MPQSLEVEKRQQESATIFLRKAIWCHDSSLISSFCPPLHHTWGSAAKEEDETRRGKKKRKSAALIRCRPIGRACP